jgi:DNA-binding beta-propeller fold protein YncE
MAKASAWKSDTGMPVHREGGMKKVYGVLLGLTLIVAIATLVEVRHTASAQQRVAAEREKPIALIAAVPLPGVKGRFDHFATGGGKLFVAALGSNAVEVIDLDTRTLDHTITGVPFPQSVLFSPEANKLFVASGERKLYIYDGASFKLITSIDFEGGADNLRYDAENKRVYVANGDDEKTGAITAVDAMTNKRLDEEYKLGAEPESFQLEKSGPNIYVNLPGLKQIAVINRTTKAITRWSVPVESNFPMALDEADHRLFIATQGLPRFLVIDTNSGHVVAVLPCGQNTDDLFYDPSHKRIYIPSGEGYLYVFQQTDPDHYQLLDKVATDLGARTGGYFGKQGKGFNRMYLAVPNRANHDAEILVYHLLED